MENEQTKFMEKVDTFLELSKSTTEGITALRDSIDSFTNNVKELKKLPELDASLAAVNENMATLDSCHKKLTEVFANVDKYATMEQQLTEHKANFETIDATLHSISEFIDKILTNTDKLNIEDIAGSLSNLTEKFEELNYYISEYIIKTFNEKLNNSVFTLKKELNALQESFNSYKQESTRIVDEVRGENQSIKDYFAEVIKSNNELMALIKSLQQNNSEGEKYLNNVIEKWYIDNIGFLGMKKKDQ
ncbi:MAG: hypothetical protein IJ966_00165 [Bacilli bacterium]|jgi:methyl-accepting chemotaxis protein|nr:hypothetical protein [Bacilli bacterium]